MSSLARRSAMPPFRDDALSDILDERGPSEEISS